jgi:hypothetical protein
MFSSRLLCKETARQVLRGRSAFSARNVRVRPVEQGMGSFLRSFSSQEKMWQEQGILDENGLTAFSTIRKCRLLGTGVFINAKFVSHSFLQTKCKSMPAKSLPATTYLDNTRKKPRSLNILPTMNLSNEWTGAALS